jgi:hypothetical protein
MKFFLLSLFKIIKENKMIYLADKDILINNPNQELSIEIKNYLFENLKKGRCVFVIPEDFDQLVSDAKKHKKNYKVGFLYDLLGVIYFDFGKEKKHEIISEKYHLWFTYRQFKTLIDEYEIDRNKYLLKRNLLK